MKRLRIATFNINGINARLSNLLTWLERETPDVVCLQELKTPDKSFPAKDIEAAGYGVVYQGQTSWNGVAILARDAQPLEIRRGLPGAEWDNQARYIEAAAHGVVVACLYLPNGNPRPGPKFDYKLAWFEHLIEHVETLQALEHPVVLAGDFNVVPTDFDIYNTRSWLKDALLQPESRACYQRLMDQGWVDAIRHFHPDEQIFTYWDYFRRHWQTNSGLRIDHLLLNPALATHLVAAGVDTWVRGEEHPSDHAPTWIEIGGRKNARELSAVTAEKGAVRRTRATSPEAKAAPADLELQTSKSSKKHSSGTMPETLQPQLATLVESAPPGEWRYEIKFDGYRVLTRILDGEVTFFTRNGHDWTKKLPEQAAAVAALDIENGWLDGEMVVPNDKGLPDFQALQNAFDSGASGDIIYYLFDLPYLNGDDLRSAPVEERRDALAALLNDSKSETKLLRFSDDFEEAPEALLNSACQMQMEGLIGKRVGSTYRSRRSDDWIKLKCKRRQEFVVVGYTDPKGARAKFGALLLALHDSDSGELKYAGKVGTGFNESTLNSLHAELRSLVVRNATVANPPKGPDARGVHWLKPVLLAEISFAQITKDGIVRHAVFQGLRADKPAVAITEELPTEIGSEPEESDVKPVARKLAKRGGGSVIGKLRLTHPNRVIDPSSSLTKRDLAEYYVRTLDWIIPQLANRPVALVRAPEGIGAQLFFQKNPESLAIQGIDSISKAQAGHPAMVINTPEALLGAVQMNTIELHTWNATSGDLRRPDRFVLDLDPDPSLPWKSMVEATQLTLTVLDELGLQSFLKTSGGKGIHIVVPLTPKDSWEEVKAFSQNIVKYMARLIPDRFSAVSGPKNRVGRIFIDYLRNGLGATTICAYSVRAREGLSVSVPIHREEVSELEAANAWTIVNLHKRLDQLDEDPWARLPDTKQTITREMRRRIGIK